MICLCCGNKCKYSANKLQNLLRYLEIGAIIFLDVQESRKEAVNSGCKAASLRQGGIK